MAIEQAIPHLDKDFKSVRPIRLDYVAIGIDVLKDLAEKRGTTYEYVVGKGKKGENPWARRLRTRIRQDFFKVNDELLNLTRAEIATVFRSSEDAVSYARRTDFQIQLKRTISGKK